MKKDMFKYCSKYISKTFIFSYNLSRYCKLTLLDVLLDPEFLELELTETILMKDLEKTI